VELAKLQQIGYKLGWEYLFAPPRASDSMPPLSRGPLPAASKLVAVGTEELRASLLI
jgi:hypothetical protein